MSEDQTEPLNEHPTNPTPFEQHVKNQLELILTRLDSLESSLRAEMIERFLQVSQQVRKVNEKVDDLDEKVGVFIREQVHIKRDLREVQDSLTPKN